MFLSNLLGIICLVVCDGGPSDHFATIAEKFIEEGRDVHVFSSSNALKKFQERNIVVQTTFNLNALTSLEQDRLAIEIAKGCSNAELVVTDLGNSFDVKVQSSLKAIFPEIKRYAYYDNPEPFVPGGYSSIASEVMSIAQRVLFANTNLAKENIFSAPGEVIDLDESKRIGIGYYPIQNAEKIAKSRGSSHKGKLREEFFNKVGVVDKGQKLLVYFGGNNEEYFKRAFPSFIDILGQSLQKRDLSNFCIVFQQHPAAKFKNRDGEYLKKTELIKDTYPANFIVSSPLSSEDIQVIADAAMYYQTSMGPQFLLAGIPVVQIGHEKYSDVLIKNHLCPSVTDARGFLSVLDNLDQLTDSKYAKLKIYQSLGIDPNWSQNLLKELQEPALNIQGDVEHAGEILIGNKGSEFNNRILSKHCLHF